MDAVQLRKFNKVGANSRPNGFVMLFGKTTEPVMREMVDQEPIPADWTYSTYCRKYLDESLYIPVQYRNAGYKVTTFYALLTAKTSSKRKKNPTRAGKALRTTYTCLAVLFGPSHGLRIVLVDVKQ
ncbi:hypothetical protein OESDEN_06248 [Oesophagostomum dentatum]|uniref:Uncharacterized protein n=1 Tax=Oesophagostomum dentatum TaxID=61180 RepID=A0A0B1T8E5_OESDE|nr:hypothetical protein OESDEN_06248 [Oesophagostomum dentatum]